MFVCLCKGITESQVHEAIQNGASTVKEISDVLGVARECGGCAKFTKELLHTTASYSQIKLHEVA